MLIQLLKALDAALFSIRRVLEKTTVQRAVLNFAGALGDIRRQKHADSNKVGLKLQLFEHLVFRECLENTLNYVVGDT